MWKDDAERMANWITDMDVQWWPFAFLRPSQEVPMSTALVMLLSVLYALPVGLLMNVLAALNGEATSPLLFPVLSCTVYFVIYRSTFALFWNRRATRLTRGQRALAE